MLDIKRYVYIYIYIDIKKAFNTVWHQGLLVKLHHKAILNRIWHTGTPPPLALYLNVATTPNDPHSCRVSAIGSNSIFITLLYL